MPELNISARAIVTTDFDNAEWFINGYIWTDKHIELYQSKVKTIYLALNSNSVDQVIINKKEKMPDITTGYLLRK